MELLAPSHWHNVDFISDLHLHDQEPETFQVWAQYLAHTTADAVFILGDLFEAWVGDDILTHPDAAQDSGFERQCAKVMHAAAARTPLYLMQGNRDFLMGASLAQACAATLLQDPCVLAFAGQRWLLTHGDAWCLADTAYMEFRRQVRSPQWQQDFLQKPLPERLALARQMRAQSEALKRTDTVYADVDHTAAIALLESHRADHMIHGHTHRPAYHPLTAQHGRWVLSDWDGGAVPPRAEVLRISQSASGTEAAHTVQRLSPLAATLRSPSSAG